MKKHVVAILGGKQDGNTHNLLKFLEKHLHSHDIQMEFIPLNSRNIKDCQGCEQCVLGDGCVMNDDMLLIKELMMHADGIILASPVYNNNISGKMKMFIDRTAKWAHSPVLTSKPYLGVTTTSSSGLKLVLKYLTTVGVNWGAHPIGNIWASKRKIPKKKNLAVLKRFIVSINLEPTNHRPTLNQIIQFQVKKVLAKTVFPNDYAFWQQNGWLNTSYYYICKINPVNRLMGTFFHWMFLKIMSNAVKKYKHQIGSREYGKLVYE